MSRIKCHHDVILCVLLEEATSQLGDAFRRFIRATDHITTVELRSEAEKRTRAANKKKAPAKKKSAPAGNKKSTSGKRSQPPPQASSGFAYRVVQPAPKDGENPTILPTASLDAPPNEPPGNALPPKVNRIVRQALPETPPSQPGSSSTVPPVPIPVGGSTITTAPAVSPDDPNISIGSPPVPRHRDGEIALTAALTESDSRKPKKMNISTVKFHALGHYPGTVRFIGPTDLYSSKWGENCHRSPKAWFKLTSKRFIRKELSMHERRRQRLKQTKYQLLTKGKSTKAQELREQRLAARNPDIHHYIGTSKSTPVYVSQFSSNGNLSHDVACSFFTRRLKNHLLPRFLRALDPNVDDAAIQEALLYLDWSKVALKDDRIYTHKIMRIKYETYDTRKDEDIIHLETDQCNIMLPNPKYAYGSSGHPFLYAKVIGILHAEVGYIGDIGRQGTNSYFFYPMELLWVRWYKVHPAVGKTELDQAELLPIDAPDSHSFIDPLQVLRACHIIPNFSEGPRYPNNEGKSPIAGDGSDWNRYFINKFVDRDMFMRYEWGLAVGHTYAFKDATAANLQILGARVRVDTVPASGASTATGAEPGNPGDTGQSFDGGIEAGDVVEGNSGLEDAEGSEDEGEGENEDELREEGESDDDYSDLRDIDDEAEKEFALFGTYS